MNSVNIKIENNREIQPAASDLVEQLESLVKSELNETNINDIAKVFTALRKEVAPIGVVYSTREKAALRREIDQLMNAGSQDLRDLHFDQNVDKRQDLLEKSSYTLALWNKYQEQEDSEPVMKESNELLGNIFIVGWW